MAEDTLPHVNAVILRGQAILQAGVFLETNPNPDQDELSRLIIGIKENVEEIRRAVEILTNLFRSEAAVRHLQRIQEEATKAENCIKDIDYFLSRRTQYSTTLKRIGNRVVREAVALKIYR